MNFGKLLKAASRLPVLLRLLFVHLFETLERALGFLRLKNLLSDQQDQNLAFS